MSVGTPRAHAATTPRFPQSGGELIGHHFSNAFRGRRGEVQVAQIVASSSSHLFGTLDSEGCLQSRTFYPSSTRFSQLLWNDQLVPPTAPCKPSLHN